MSAHQLRKSVWLCVLLTLSAMCRSGQAQVPRTLPVPEGQETKAQPATLEQLAERLRTLEEASKRPAEPAEKTPAASGSTASGATDAEKPASISDSPVPDYTDGLFSPTTVPQYPSSGISNPGRVPLKATFGPGFLLRSEDEWFSLQIHYESQIDYRGWEQGDQSPANSGFFLPRQRMFFNGTITKPVEYEFSFNRGLGGLNLLNAYLNFHFDDALEFRIGRYFTPFTYDQYAVSNYWLITPERSVFTTNLSPNRQFGAMFWGYLLNKKLDYAVGMFNGSRNTFEDPDNNRDVVAFVNLRPFQDYDELPFAQFLNIGTSVAFGRQSQSPSPATFRIAGGSPDTNIPGNATVPFLILNPDVSEQGDRLLGSVHLAYFYKGLSLIGEWQYGYGHYARGNNVVQTRVPFSGYYVSAGYFVTGEEVERRTRVKPLRPVFPTKEDQDRGCGAWELAAGVSQLRLGTEVFQAGLADRALWANSATTVELGVNWYLNEYLKVAMFWLRGEFNEPVQYRPGQFQKSADLFWVRTQLYF